MNDRTFKTWLTNRDRYDQTTANAAKDHMASCKSCKMLYSWDALLEARISEPLIELEPPRGLLARIKNNFQFEATGQGRNTHFLPLNQLAAALAMVAVMVVIVFQPYSGHIKNFDQIGTFALAEHLSSDLEMTFKAQEVSDAPGWFSERVGFGIVIPALESQGFQFLGGRECLFGKKKAAYLYYDCQGQKVSLFIINYQDLDFPLSRHRTYTVYDRGHEIKIWKQGTLCYALVKSPSVRA